MIQHQFFSPLSLAAFDIDRRRLFESEKKRENAHAACVRVCVLSSPSPFPYILKCLLENISFSLAVFVQGLFSSTTPSHEPDFSLFALFTTRLRAFVDIYSLSLHACVSTLIRRRSNGR